MRLPRHTHKVAAPAARLALKNIARVSCKLSRRPWDRTNFIDLKTMRPVSRGNIAKIHTLMTKCAFDFNVYLAVGFEAWDGENWDAGYFDLEPLFGKRFMLSARSQEGKGVYEEISRAGDQFVQKGYRRDSIRALGNIILPFQRDIDSELACELCDIAWKTGFEVNERGQITW